MRLADEEIVGFVALLLVAGHVTTTALLGNAVVTFDRHPGTLAALREDPAGCRTPSRRYCAGCRPSPSWDGAPPGRWCSAATRSRPTPC
ncbi:hypothetical protein ACR6C2_42305 [Streptomyces sp. INA 01156]